jgi:acetolactate synthase-1/2/3 large subunit
MSTSTTEKGGAARVISGGEAVVESLLDHGVDTVFGIPGIQLDPLFDGFYAHGNRLRLVHTRHEQGAAFMAMGYAQSSDRTGVFAVVPGPGLLNAMAAVSTGVAANTPMLGITGQIPSYQIGLNYGMAHELRDQLAMSAGVVSWTRRADHPSEVPRLLRDAFRFMHSGRKQPAIFEMAPDRFAARAPVVALPPATPVEGAEPDAQQVRRAAQKLAAARRPAIFVGGGVLGATAELRALAERLQAPVIESPNARGALPSDHPLCFTLLDGQGIWETVDVALVVRSDPDRQAARLRRGDPELSATGHVRAAGRARCRRARA